MEEGDVRRTGFTMVELLIVILVIGILMGIVAYSITSLSERARLSNTEGLLDQIKSALQSYYNDFKKFPPDGFDQTVTAPNGKALRGTACLAYFLGWVYRDGGKLKHFQLKKTRWDAEGNESSTQVNEGKPYMELKENQLTPSGEIKDGWGNAMHYDCLEEDDNGNVQFSRQASASVHLPPIPKYHGPDPRTARGAGKGFNPGRYDIWSNGPDGHEEGAKADDDVLGGVGSK